MRARLGSLLVGMICVLVLFHESAKAARASRIELNDGTIFQDVDYQVDNVYKVITIKGADFERSVSFTAVKLVIDSDGVDVTEDCLGRYYNPAPEKSSPAPPGTVTELSLPENAMPTMAPIAPAPGSARAPRHPFSVGFRAGGNYSFPEGNWFWGSRSGMGFDADLIITVARRIALRASISKSGIRHNSDELFEGSVVMKDELSFRVWRYLLAVQYYDWPRWRSKGNLMYSAWTGMGVTTHQLTGTAIVYDPYLDEYLMYAGNGESLSKFTLTSGGSIAVMASRTVGFELSGELDLLFVESENYGEAATPVIFDLKAGMIFLVR